MAEQIRVSFHLGPHKTATTHFQATMRENKELLAKRGVRFYGPQYLRNRDRTIEKMFGMHDRARIENKRSPEEQLAFLAKGGKRVLFSEENFIGPLHDGRGHVALPLYPEAVSRLGAFRERLPDVPLRLFLSIRRPDTFLQSAYSQTLLAGTIMQPDTFRRRNPIEETDWVDLIDRLAKIVDLEGLYVWRFEEYGQLLKILTRPMIGWGFARTLQVKETPVNQGLSAAALDQMLEWMDQGKIGDLAAQARKKYPVCEAYPKFQLYADEVAHAAENWYATQIEELRERERVNLIELSRNS